MDAITYGLLRMWLIMFLDIHISLKMVLRQTIALKEILVLVLMLPLECSTLIKCQRLTGLQTQIISILEIMLLVLIIVTFGIISMNILVVLLLQIRFAQGEQNWVYSKIMWRIQELDMD